MRAYRIAEIYMFDTCTHKCGYCRLAESGQVLDFSQLEPFRDAAFIEKITSFFLSRTTPGTKWLLQLTGGEVDTTEICNLSCVMCHFNGPNAPKLQGTLTVEEVRRSVSSIPRGPFRFASNPKRGERISCTPGAANSRAASAATAPNHKAG